MLSTAKKLRDYRLDSRDGEIGKVREFYFDDRFWTIRYLVADTGYWLTGRQVLISPYALIAMERNIYNLTIKVDLTKKQIEDSPSLNTDKPVSRQFEDSYYGYYGWPPYWNGLYTWGPSPQIERDHSKWSDISTREDRWDPNLRSTRAVTGYHILATDGEIGHVEDFIIDDDNWTIRYLVVSTKNWWPGKKVLISPEWIENISWEQSLVNVKVSCEEIKQSPEYTEESLITRDYETSLYGHYHRKEYWLEGMATR